MVYLFFKNTPLFSRSQRPRWECIGKHGFPEVCIPKAGAWRRGNASINLVSHLYLLSIGVSGSKHQVYSNLSYKYYHS